MAEETKTLFELAPDTFVMPGQAKNGDAPPKDLVFERDKSAPGVLYRAKLEPGDMGKQDQAELKIRKPSIP